MNKSCKILKKITPYTRKKHGLSGTSIHITWRGMMNRCYNPKDSRYKYYGGRGVKICKRWYDVINFYKDMGDRPSDKHSIDRINNNVDYKPTKCMWTIE